MLLPYDLRERLPPETLVAEEAAWLADLADPSGPADGTAALMGAAAARCCAAEPTIEPRTSASRRRRLWELGAHAHCPVVGVCMPLAVARRLGTKVWGEHTPADDYELHGSLVTDCRTRTPAAEAVNKVLDERHAHALRRAAACKRTDALAAWWRAESPGAGLPGALWAVLTHAHCSPALESAVLGQVHMRQHQVGCEARVEQAQLSALQAEHRALRDELEALRQRSLRAAEEHAAERERAQAKEMQLRGEVLAREALLGQLHDELACLKRAAPDLPSRHALAQQLQAQTLRAQGLQRALTQAQDLAQRHADAIESAGPARPRSAGLVESTPESTLETASPAPRMPGPPAANADLSAALHRALEQRTVLCVGGRTSAVPAYRRLLEELGARFEHHDGGQEHGPQRLQACLGAADWVICQAGCVSHDAYWRVKEHCKRTGTPCAFVAGPSASSLRRALADAVAKAAADSPHAAAAATLGPFDNPISLPRP
jgi:hypothetical protein